MSFIVITNTDKLKFQLFKGKLEMAESICKKYYDTIKKLSLSESEDEHDVEIREDAETFLDLFEKRTWISALAVADTLIDFESVPLIWFNQDFSDYSPNAPGHNVEFVIEAKKTFGFSAGT